LPAKLFSGFSLDMALLIASAPQGHAQGGGPPGGTVYALAIDPFTPATLYAGTYRGVFKSANGGANWTDVGLGTSVFEVLAIDPSTPSTVYTASYQNIYKSTNAGASWIRVTLPSSVEALAVDPSTSTIVYAGTTS
jgi:hypothetical protein